MLTEMVSIQFWGVLGWVGAHGYRRGWAWWVARSSGP